jgi:hypothetical protein
VAAQETSALTLALVAGGFTAFGVVAKIAYDSVIAGRAAKREGIERLAPERREAYERFLDAVQRERSYQAALRGLLDAHRQGKMEITDEEQAAFPDSPMPDVIAALDQVHLLARVYSVITAAEAIIRLFIDMDRATRAALETPGTNDEITWFLLQRFVEDRISEFVHGYREDLGLGHPAGGPKRYPIPERPWPLATGEAIIRSHLPAKDRRSEPHAKPSEERDGQ